MKRTPGHRHGSVHHTHGNHIARGGLLLQREYTDMDINLQTYLCALVRDSTTGFASMEPQ